MVAKNNTSGYKGVYFNKKANKWMSYIRYNNKLINLGLFVNPIDAAIAYNNKALELFGEYARLNIIPEQQE